MEYLFQINPILQKEDRRIVIYGIEQEQKRLFHALLQQNISVYAFCRRDDRSAKPDKIFGKRVIRLRDLKDEFRDAIVIISGKSACEDSHACERAGICNIVVENITSDAQGILMEDDPE